MGFFDWLKPLATVATGGLAAGPLAVGEGIAKGKPFASILGDTMKAGSQGIASAASDVAGNIGGDKAEGVMDAAIGLSQTAATLGAGGGLAGVKSVGDAAGAVKGVSKAAESAGGVADSLGTTGLSSSLRNAARGAPSKYGHLSLTSGDLPPDTSTYTPVGDGATPASSPLQSPGGSLPNPFTGQSQLQKQLSPDMYSGLGGLPQGEQADALMNVDGLTPDVAEEGGGLLDGLGFRDYLSLSSGAGNLIGKLTAPKPKEPFRPGGNIGGRYQNMFKRGL